MVVLAIPVIIIKFLFKHKGLLIALIIAGVALFAVNYYNSHNQQASDVYLVDEAQQKMPDKNLAPLVVATSSRYYPTVSLQPDGDTTTLTDYFSYENGRWIKCNIPLPLKSSEIKIYER